PRPSCAYTTSLHDALPILRTQEGGGDDRPALDQHVPDAAVEQLGQGGRRVVREQAGLLAGAVDRREGRRGAGAHDDPQRLAVVERPVRPTGGEGGVVGAGGAGADQHGVAGGAQEVDLLAGGRAGDPLAGAVGGGGASVQ